ncbi:cupin domain-containing protein [Pseudoalteromonas sp. S16_S37]|uniref:cupin domain-containing protein n=1 Tax=Pseudoalteromonas sp. S16_S37 TaxID=2720228 RepID=UPI001EEDEAE9|nr:cupin domain-containing protein [Pseudoalteromonas sp. S16_S37]
MKMNVYVLEGNATAQIGEHHFAIKAGDFIGYRAGGEAHTIINTGTTTFKCIVVGQRLAHDVGDYPNLQKRIYRQKDLPWNLVDIASISEPKAGKKV